MAGDWKVPVLFGPVSGDGCHAFIADPGVLEDGCLGTDELRALGHRTSMVPVSGAGHRHSGRHATNLWGSVET